MEKRALIVTALAGFVRSFLTHDIQLLQKMGYEVHCAANKDHPGAEGIDEYFRKNHVIFHQVPFSSNQPLSSETIVAYKEIKKFIKKEHLDVVHCHTPIAGAICRLACRKQQNSGLKVLYTTHGFYFHKDSGKKSWLLFRTIEDFLSRFTDAIITINKEDSENAKKMHCAQVYHINGVGVDTERFRNVEIDRDAYRISIGVAADELMVLAVGELSERKNQKVVIEALGKLQLQNVVFVHCGNAMNKSGTTNALVKLAQEKQVRMLLLGFRKDTPQICRCADIGTISSTREGLGLAGIEMLASGLPVVASRVHGILDYMQDGVNGYLADPYSPDEFAEAIRKLAEKQNRAAMKEKCIESAKDYDKSISFRQMEDIYHKVLISE
jgi:glycosyltransferase involved in cell wall biosynthesis